MPSPMEEKHNKRLPNQRSIRRACRRELERTIKRLKQRIPTSQVDEATKLYFQKVILNLPFILEHQSNRKVQADWWEEHVAPEIAQLWNVDQDRLARAFRQAYGG